MSGVTKIEIAESVEELKLLMKQQKTALGFAKVQTLYLLKINAIENINHEIAERAISIKPKNSLNARKDLKSNGNHDN